MQTTTHPRPLAGRIALVTGAARGIGAAIARTLGEQGATVVVNYVHSRERAEEVVDTIRAAGLNNKLRACRGTRRNVP